MISVAIDGPAGAGKSTISRYVAKRLGFTYIDTGALYRALGYKALNNNIPIENVCEINRMLENTEVDIILEQNEQHIYLDNMDINAYIRTPQVSMAASKISAIKSVRKFLLNKQRDMANKYNVIMDGRDIGTVVLPNATLKIYLTASAEDRADRRYKELIEKGQDVVYKDVLADVIQRDYNDMNRVEAPLKQAPGSILIDTTGNTFEQSCELLYNTIKENIQ